LVHHEGLVKKPRIDKKGLDTIAKRPRSAALKGHAPPKKFNALIGSLMMEA